MVATRARRARAGIAAIVASAASAGVLAAPGTAGTTPQGKGLLVFPIPFYCDGIGEVIPTVAPSASPPGGPAWILNGQLVLIQEVTVVQDGAVVFHKVYGAKTGQQPTVTCMGTEGETTHIVQVVLVP